MQKIDISPSGNMKALAQLSYAFGIPGAAFVLKYLYDFYGAGIRLPAVIYMLPIGAALLLVSLIFAPAVYKITVPNLNSLIAHGLAVSQSNSNDPSYYRARQWTSILKTLRIIILCSHPCFFFLLLVSTAQYLAA